MIRLALLTAEKSEHPRFRLGAILTQGPNILSLGVNKLKTHPLSRPHKRKKGHSIHAELDAIIGVPRHHLQRATMYVARLLADGSPGMAKPCFPCHSLLTEVGIERVIYTTGTQSRGQDWELIPDFKIEKLEGRNEY